jgi:predicted O-methyltransferase YrrM
METNSIDNLQTAWGEHKIFSSWLVNYLQPTTTVELGVDYGYSLFCLAEARIGKVYGFDVFESDQGYSSGHDTYDVVMEFKQKHNYDNVEVIKGDYTEAVKTWTKPIQILHIDGDHSYEGCKRDFDNWSPLVEDGGIILMHDINSQSWGGTVGKVYSEIEGWSKGRFNEAEGLGILVKNNQILKDIKSNFANFDTLGKYEN